MLSELLYLPMASRGFALCQERLSSVYQGLGEPIRAQGGVAIIDVFGVITYGDSWLGTSVQEIASAFQSALTDDSKRSILLNVNSPGGTIAGVEDLTDMIYESRGRKPIVAYANPLAASAAYWIASAAGKFYAAPMSEVGSIGVFRMHTDYSQQMADDGVKVTFISDPEFKTEGNPYEPLKEETKAYYQEQNLADYRRFIAAVARNRGVDVGAVEAGYGRGRIVSADDGVKAGMVDGIKRAFTVAQPPTRNSRRARVEQLTK